MYIRVVSKCAPCLLLGGSPWLRPSGVTAQKTGRHWSADIPHGGLAAAWADNTYTQTAIQLEIILF